MFVHAIDPVLIHFGPFAIRYYGVIYALGFIMAYIAIRKAIAKKEITLSKDGADSLVLYLMIGVVLGARLFEITFYNPSYFFHNPLKMAALWEGGLSFHGGLVGAAAAAFLFCKRKEISFRQLADVLAIPAALALALGRVANFINGELYGIPSSVPWAVQFPGDLEFRHPAQIYEALKNVAIAGIVLRAKKKRHHPGYLFGMFLLLYAVMRFFIEFLKEPEVSIGPLSMGQVLSLAMIPCAIILLKKSGK